jgi:hypothetical protein
MAGENDQDFTGGLGERAVIAKRVAGTLFQPKIVMME